MPSATQNNVFDVLGTTSDDSLTDLSRNNYSAPTAIEAFKANGLEGNDTLTSFETSDLSAGDMVGNEWTFVDGRWVYDASAVVISAYGADKSFNDFITTGEGDDVLLGNGGDDTLYAGSGDDVVNGGRGNEIAFGGHGDDVMNLEDGNDFSEAGYGNDTVNAGNGDDVVYGDVKGDNLLDNGAASATTLNQLAQTEAWSITDSFGQSEISQSVATVNGETYTISFDLAANLAGGHTTGTVEVLWNGEVIDTVKTQSGAYQTFEVDVVSDGTAGELSFRALAPEASQEYNFDGPIISYEKTISVGAQDIDVHAFAAGQAKLYQVIDGQLNVFDVNEKEYVAVGDQPSFKTNAVGFNVENDMIYGVAKSTGEDSLGNAVVSSDIVMIDATGATFRVGDGFYGDYVGDFDGAGNLWTFHSAMNRISVVDVDQFGADGNPIISHYSIPSNLFTDRAYDVAYSGEGATFYAVVSPNINGGAGKVVKIDMGAVQNGGLPSVEEISFDEAWLLRAVEAAGRDRDSFEFLIRSRVPFVARRNLGSLLAGISEQFHQI